VKITYCQAAQTDLIRQFRYYVNFATTWLRLNYRALRCALGSP
jgi:hypothetical protein